MLLQLLTNGLPGRRVQGLVHFHLPLLRRQSSLSSSRGCPVINEPPTSPRTRETVLRHRISAFCTFPRRKVRKTPTRNPPHSISSGPRSVEMSSSPSVAAKKVRRNDPNPRDGRYTMGPHTLDVPMELFKLNRQRLAEALRLKDLPKNSVVLLQGGQDQAICEGDSSDVGPIFKQEAYFQWAFGVLEPDWYGSSDVETGESILFMPKLPGSYAIIMGYVETREEAKDRYRVDRVEYVDDIASVLKSKPNLLLLDGPNTDSGKQTRPAAFDGISSFTTDNKTLHPIIAECRVIKTEMELNVMRYVTKISADAHKAVMKQIKPGMREYQCESVFLHHCYFYGGCRNVCYTCICGTGHSGATLHYGHAGAANDQECQDGDMVLFDMGAEYYRYCSDITCSYPVNGKFSEKQKIVYNAVLRANRAVANNAKPGVSYRDMHLLANRETLADLKEAGLLKGDLDDMMKVNLAGRVFQPHGLGHFIGLDVHDVGGYLEGHPERSTLPGLKSLRTARVLKENMVVTIEPGCYFIDHLLDEAYQDPELSPFLNKEVLEQYRGFGGVRIEDDVIVTADGVEIMSIVPRTVEEIETWMAEGDPSTIDSVVSFQKYMESKKDK